MPVPEGGGTGERPPTQHPAEPPGGHLGQLSNRHLPLHRVAPPVAVLLHCPQHALIGLLDEPAFLLGFGPFHLLIGTQRTSLSCASLASRFHSNLYYTNNDRRKEKPTRPWKPALAFFACLAWQGTPHDRHVGKGHGVALRRCHAMPVPRCRQCDARCPIPGNLSHIHAEQIRSCFALRHGRRNHKGGHTRTTTEVFLTTEQIRLSSGSTASHGWGLGP